TPHCPEHGQPISSTSRSKLLGQLRALSGKVSLLAPVVEARKGTYLDLFNGADRAGIPHAWCDGVLIETSTPPKLSRSKEHSIDLVIVSPIEPVEITDEHLEQVFTWSNGRVRV